jgi:predicted DNA-binding transcriptional regulator AlpA
LGEFSVKGYYNDSEVEGISGNKSKSTRWRWERQGLFPKRVRLGPNSVGWRMEEVDEWADDPAGWVKKNNAASDTASSQQEDG